MAGGSGYASKPRPVVIVQDDAFAPRLDRVCLITTDRHLIPVFRVWWNPQQKGLQRTSCLMVDKSPPGQEPPRPEDRAA